MIFVSHSITQIGVLILLQYTTQYSRNTQHDISQVMGTVCRVGERDPLGTLGYLPLLELP